VKQRREAAAGIRRQLPRRSYSCQRQAAGRATQPEYRTDALQQQSGHGAEGLLQAGAELFQPPVQPAIGQSLQGRKSRAHRQRIRAQGAGLVDRARRCNQLHQFAAAAVGADREAAADDLAVSSKVGADAAQTRVALE
jgi:hypothetical protein